MSFGPAQGASSATGDAVGPASSTDNAIARFDGTTGKLLQNTSAATIDDNGRMRLPDGTSGTPSIAGSDADSGLYLNGVTTRIYANNVSMLAVDQFGISGGGVANFSGALVRIQGVTSDGTESASVCGTLDINSGASGEVIRTLPTASGGQRWRFSVETAQHLRVKANTGDVIRGPNANDGGFGTITSSASAGYWRSNEVGAYLEVLAVDATTWTVVAIAGTWTVDS